MTNRLTTLTALALAASLLLAPSRAAAHGTATLESSAPSVPAGGSVTLEGDLFVPGEAHRLVLRGTLEDHELGEVTAGSDSTFTRQLRIPADVRPGQYRLAAIAPDGDQVATLDLPILAAQRTSSAGTGEAPGGAEAEPSVAPAEARADEIEIQRSRAGLEWGAIGLVIGLAGGLGLGLVRRA